MKVLIILLSIIACGLPSFAKGNDNLPVTSTNDVSTSYDNPTSVGMISPYVVNDSTNDVPTSYDNPTSVGMISPYVVNESFDYKKTKEWKKYKVLRACGWSALGVGLPITLFGGGLAALANSMNGNGGGPGVPFIVSGGVVTLASVPLLISAYHYRNKAKNLGFGVSAIATPTPQSNLCFTPAFKVSFSF